MKKLLYFLIPVVMMVFAMMFITPTHAITSEVKEVKLFAGQTTLIGKMQVWNTEDDLYVKYLITRAGWEMTESHLYVGPKDEIPVNKPGNPIVGHFPYSKDHDPAVKEYTYKIEKSEIEGETFAIAAHAAVQRKVFRTITPRINWTRSSEENVQHVLGYGGQWNFQAVKAGFTDMTETVWDNGTFAASKNTPVMNREYASWLYDYNNGGSYDGYSDLRLFQARFNIPTNFEVTGAELGVKDYTNRIPINDTAYVYVNGELLFWGGTRANTIGTHDGMSGVQALRSNPGTLIESDRWYIPGTFPELSELKTGLNVIDVFTEENERFGGMGALAITLEGYRIVRTDSAWGFGPRINPRGNWATYFMYNWENLEPERVLVDTVTVLPNGISVNSINLENGEDYVLETSGTYRFVDWGVAGIADAKFSLRAPGFIPGGYGYDTTINQWVDGAHLPGSWQYYLQIMIDGAPANWQGSYNSTHLYTKEVVGTGSNLSFMIKDNVYTDNSGSLTVKIYKIN